MEWRRFHTLLTPDEMGQADRITIRRGVSGFVLMKAAGNRVAEAALKMIGDIGTGGTCRIACLGGPGNNGGDAFVAAELLRRSGHSVVVHTLSKPECLSGDAALAAGYYEGTVEPLDTFEPEKTDLVIDGLLGAGLSRPIEGDVAALIARTNTAAPRLLAIDLPSGVSGKSGAILGDAFQAERTVSFFRAKPGHFLEPGRTRCGSVDIRQIGIEANVLDTIRPKAFLNQPELWRLQLNLPAGAGHKYDRGHAVVFSGPALKTGAARLAANAALRAGAGLVTLLSPPNAILVNASHLTAVMLRKCEGSGDLGEILVDHRFNAFVLGPGFGTGERVRDYARLVLEAGRALVLDADGISAFSDVRNILFDNEKQPSEGEGVRLVLTPHAGEFARLFPDIAEADRLSKLDRARQAAERANAVIVLKGRDTVIASPDGRAVINANGTPWLATAGTGDVLSGIIAAQLAQGMPAFEAAAAGVWMHGRAAELFGPGLTAEELAGQLPRVFVELMEA
ncbi:YjeF family protein [Fulvimarina pelagi HTCC2506]|uniref:Bifunctional NAD(P)H-hydrate repair enzyme n=2 Tax=Fulvimarina pelagi TaxID=217511 RepID=Q0G789_9HYPH|nr:YjeF family protein [Fulvimarina pelagi HTCC2506]